MGPTSPTRGQAVMPRQHPHLVGKPSGTHQQKERLQTDIDFIIKLKLIPNLALIKQRPC